MSHRSIYRRILGAGTAGVPLSSHTSARASDQPGGQQNDRRRPGPGGGRGGPIRIAVLLDIKKVPVGSWAEYTVSQGGRIPRTVRQVLVDRDKTNATVEVIVEGRRGKTPQLAFTARKVVRMVVDLELKEVAPKEIVVQRSGAEPMALSTVQGPGRQRFSKLDPKNSLGSETVAVAAGTFETEHYRNIGPRGGAIDIWASNQVPPFGLVKMERKPGANAPPRRAAFGQVTYELVRMGTGAKPSITRPVKPLDPSLMQCTPGRPKQFKQ
jgi:hypothetical protein